MIHPCQWQEEGDTAAEPGDVTVCLPTSVCFTQPLGHLQNKYDC